MLKRILTGKESFDDLIEASVVSVVLILFSFGCLFGGLLVMLVQFLMKF
jgi:hypothetical protein